MLEVTCFVQQLQCLIKQVLGSRRRRAIMPGMGVSGTMHKTLLARFVAWLHAVHRFTEPLHQNLTP